MKIKYIKIVCIIFVSIIICGCTKKEKLSLNAFSAILSDHNFSLTDVSEYYNQNSDITKLVLANNENYQIEYYVFKDSETSKKFVDENIKNIVSNNSFSQTKKEGNNYLKYTLSSKSSYYVISQIENTVVYINSSLNYQSDIDKILLEINY